MGIFQTLFPRSPLSLIGSGILSKKENVVSVTQGETFQDVPFGNLTKVKGGSNVAYTEGQKDYSTQNYYSNPTGDAVVTVQTKKEANVSPAISQTQEKPLNISPALLGTGGSTATGEGSVKSSGSPILTYALIGAGVIAGIYVLKK